MAAPKAAALPLGYAPGMFSEKWKRFVERISATNFRATKSLSPTANLGMAAPLGAVPDCRTARLQRPLPYHLATPQECSLEDGENKFGARGPEADGDTSY